MKILHVNNYGTGFGTEKYIREIMTGLTVRGHICTLFIQDVCGGDHPLKAMQSARRNLQRLTAMIRDTSPDVIHVHNITNYRLLDRLLTSGPVLKSIHEFRPFCIPRRIRPDTGEHCTMTLSRACFTTGCFQYNLHSLYRFMVEHRGGRRIRRFPWIWVYSDFMKQFVAPLLPPSCRIDVVQYFYDPPPGDPGDPPESRRIFSAGRLVRDKGYHLLLDAVATLKEPVELTIAGEGNQETALREQAARLGLTVNFIGYHPPSELERWYRWCKVAAFPSDYPEPFGIVGLEAMGAARPVVAFDVGGVRDWLDDGSTGYCVPRGDTRAFSEKLHELLTNKETATAMGREGRRQVLEKFSSKHHIERLELTYREIVSAHA
ncbi:glycosyltransferase family 4 protein [bacterium]|nr:glycosyltransferase family 4 protein [candidate division CSSED10-310 bacterium]